MINKTPNCCVFFKKNTATSTMVQRRIAVSTNAVSCHFWLYAPHVVVDYFCTTVSLPRRGNVWIIQALLFFFPSCWIILTMIWRPANWENKFGVAKYTVFMFTSTVHDTWWIFNLWERAGWRAAVVPKQDRFRAGSRCGMSDLWDSCWASGLGCSGRSTECWVCLTPA